MPDGTTLILDANNVARPVTVTGDMVIAMDGRGTLNDKVVTNAKLVDVPANTIKGNNTALSGSPIDLTVSQAQTLLGIGSSVVLQVKNYPFTSVATGTTLMTQSATAPTNTQGDLYYTVVFTPKSAISMLNIQVSQMVYTGLGSPIIGALFQDSITTAIGVGSTSTSGGTAQMLNFTVEMTSGTTNPITFRFRAGCVSTLNTLTVNGANGSALFGGKTGSGLFIIETVA